MQFAETYLKSAKIVNTLPKENVMENSSYFAIFLRIIDEDEWFGKNTEIPTFSIYFQEKSTVRVPKSWQEPHVQQHEFLLQKVGTEKCSVLLLLKERDAPWITYDIKSYLDFNSKIVNPIKLSSN